MNSNIFIFAIFAVLMLFGFGFMLVFFLDIKKHSQYSPYILLVFRIVMIVAVIIACFGAYKILTTESHDFGTNPFDTRAEMIKL